MHHSSYQNLSSSQNPQVNNLKFKLFFDNVMLEDKQKHIWRIIDGDWVFKRALPRIFSIS